MLINLVLRRLAFRLTEVVRRRNGLFSNAPYTHYDCLRSYQCSRLFFDATFGNETPSQLFALCLNFFWIPSNDCVSLA